jgi:hemerythrin-like metal-binding protein
MVIETHPHAIDDSRIRLLEDQHDAIFDAIIEAQLLCDEQAATPMVIEAINEILSAARFHFGEEEKILRDPASVVASGISSFEAHQALHSHLLDQILKMRRRAELFDREALPRQLLILDGWLRMHIAKETAVPPSWVTSDQAVDGDWRRSAATRWINTTLVQPIESRQVATVRRA